MLGSEIGESPKIALILSLVLGGCQQEQGGVPHSLFSHPQLEATQRVMHLDPIPFGESREAFYTLTNTTDESIFIRRVGPTGCSCASVPEIIFDSRPPVGEVVRIDPSGCRVEMMPGEQARIRLILDTARYREPISRSHGSVPVWTEGHEGALLLEWGADIWTPFWLEPWSLQLGAIGAMEKAGGSISIAGHDTDAFDVLVPASMHGWKLTKTKAPREGANLYIIRIEAQDELPLGPLNQEFVLYSNLQGAPPIRFWVQGLVEPNLSWSPRRILLLPGRGRSSAELIVLNRNPEIPLRLSPPSLEGISPDSLLVNLGESQGNRQQGIQILWKGPPPAEDLEGWIQVETGMDNFPALRVPILVLAPEESQS